MRFQNPWIDPRVMHVRPADAQAYLLRHGWKAMPEQGGMPLFEGPPGGGEGAIIRVPVKDQARDYTQRVIELITDLAVAEDRYAVEVLNDILRPSAEPRSANGSATATQAEPAVK